MSDFDAVPIVDVHNENFSELWPSIALAIQSASFLAIDTELSGLGNRRGLGSNSTEDRYSTIREAAETRSIISFGVSCFKLESATSEENTDKKWQYFVQTFNITTLCSDSYTVEADALKFLVNHGFDFNKQYSKGIPYYRGNDKKKQAENSSSNARKIMDEIVKSKRIIVLHNGLIDVMFLYHCWYAELPMKLGVFIADLCEIFEGGIIDTKYVTEFKARMTSSYLEYIFKKTQRENAARVQNNQPQVCIRFMKFPINISCVEYKPFCIESTGENSVSRSSICLSYAYHGWCSKGNNCSLSHNVDCILDMETTHKKRKSKRNGIPSDLASKQPKLNEQDGETLIPKSEYSTQSSAKSANGEVGSKNAKHTKETFSSNVVDEICSSSPTKGCNPSTDLVEASLKMCSFNSQSSENGDLSNLELSIKSNNGCGEVSLKRLQQKSSGHRAGCDAFMTGFTLAYYLTLYCKLPSSPSDFSSEKLEIMDIVNKIYLTGKTFPLNVQKSSFTKCSKNHTDKFEKLKVSSS